MTAPTRIVYADRNAYALDPYVRDAGGRFALKPTEPLPPIQVLEAQATRIDLSNGNGAAWTTGPDPACSWRVRVVRDDAGEYRVLYEH